MIGTSKITKSPTSCHACLQQLSETQSLVCSLSDNVMNWRFFLNFSSVFIIFIPLVREGVSLIFLDACNEDQFKKSASSYFYAYVEIQNDTRFQYCVKDRVFICIQDKQIFL